MVSYKIIFMCTMTQTGSVSLQYLLWLETLEPIY